MPSARTWICDKRVQRQLSSVQLRWRRPCVSVPLAVLHKGVRLGHNTLMAYTRRHWNEAVFKEDQRNCPTFLQLNIYGNSLDESPGSGKMTLGRQ